MESAYDRRWFFVKLRGMKINGCMFACCCLLFTLGTNGCVTHQREAFLKSNSLKKFMADRPPAADLLRQHPLLERWLLIEWNRPIEGYRIFWSNEEPVASPTAEHAPYKSYRLIVIRVSDKLVPADQLLALAYETCNAQGHSDFDKVKVKAVSGKITRADYVNAIEEREYCAILRLKGCFPEMLPLSKNEVAATTLYRKLLEVPIGFHDYQAWSIRTHSSNYLHAQELYGRQYDQLAKQHSP
jgi:hypothetical protein